MNELRTVGGYYAGVSISEKYDYVRMSLFPFSITILYNEICGLTLELSILHLNIGLFFRSESKF